jgi:hypothetical protein
MKRLAGSSWGRVFFVACALTLCSAARATDWPMPGANPQRTSWTPDHVEAARVKWFRPFQAYIMPHVQMVVANGTVFVASARGLYALDAGDGRTQWVFPTELPLGQAPTVDSGVVYVGGLDGNLYALNAADGSLRWSFRPTRELAAGWSVNPLVANGMVYAGNRNGYFYAVQAASGLQAWSFKTDGPILFSAAYKDGTVYFASNDSCAYALDAASGALVWKTFLPTGDGFHCWWPVIYDKDAGHRLVIFNGARAYRGEYVPRLNMGEAEELSKGDEGVVLDQAVGGNYRSADPAIRYLNAKPWKRTFFVVQRDTGQEMREDLNNDGVPDYAPLLYAGTNDGPTFPPAVGPGPGGVTLVYHNNYVSRIGSQPRFDVVGWNVGTNLIYFMPNGYEYALDEPVGFCMGGYNIYKAQICDRSLKAFDIRNGSSWSYEYPSGYAKYTAGWGGLPGYTVVFGGNYGIYGYHGNVQNPLVPVGNRLYTHKSNAVICYEANYSGGVANSADVLIQPAASASRPVDPVALKQKLAEEIQKILDAGHLRSGYKNDANDYFSSAQYNAIEDYFHEPWETLYVLSRALPWLGSAQQSALRAYLKSEWSGTPPQQYGHLGFAVGASRSAFQEPLELRQWMAQIPKNDPYYFISPWAIWHWNPYMFYCLWKYAQAMNLSQSEASALFEPISGYLGSPTGDFRLRPGTLNAWVAGYKGYYELAKLAGYADNSSRVVNARNTYNSLLAQRAAGFYKDPPWSDPLDSLSYPGMNALNVAGNFMWLTRELGQYLRDHILNQVQDAYNQYVYVAPYWFVSNFEATFLEHTMHHNWDSPGLLACKAYIFKESREELAKYLDAPAFLRGDLFYIGNLLTVLEAGIAPPIINPPGGGTFINPVTVSLAQVGGATIRYTLDGSDPTSTSAVYTGPIVLNGSTTLKARAFQDSDQSEVAVAVFSIAPGAANQAPVVNAGPDLLVAYPNPVNLAGSVSDNTLPYPPGYVTSTWSQRSGPGTVTFANPLFINTSAQFSQVGTYVLRLTASDGSLQAYDEVTVTVASSSGAPAAPTNLRIQP